jgi:hypothetical protein
MATALMFAISSPLHAQKKPPDCPPSGPKPNISACVGHIPDLLKSGYQFSAGSDISPDQTERVRTKTSIPPTFDNAKYNTGSLYLQKGTDLLVCRYTIVTENPQSSGMPSPQSALAQSYCYRIQ